MLLDMNVCSIPLYTADASAVNISFVSGVAGSSKVYSSVILNDVHPTYMQIALIWGFLVQLSL